MNSIKLIIPFFACFLYGFASANPPAFTEDGFRVPQPGEELTFPRDHAAHPNYKIEWWYLTGHLENDQGQEFGYQATFFRFALKSPENQTQDDFDTDQLYLTHMAMTDVDGENFYHDSRLYREGWDANASTETLNLRHGNWSLRMTDQEPDQFELVGGIRGDIHFRFFLTAKKPLVRFGRDGTSRKGKDPTARSFYISHTNLNTTGTLNLKGRELQVSGTSWMDHEIASQQLSDNLTGWDWTAIHLDNGWEIKAYRLRTPEGGASPYSECIWIDPDGNFHYSPAEEWEWVPGGWWTSDVSKAEYPIAPSLKTIHPHSGEPVTFKLNPRLQNQEIRDQLGNNTYWEGACEVLNEDGNPVGRAYLELVGYGSAGVHANVTKP